MESRNLIKNISFSRESTKSITDFRTLYFRANILQADDFSKCLSLAVSQRQSSTMYKT